MNSLRNFLAHLLRTNRGEGPKPSGICLWQDVKQLEQLVQELTEEAMQQTDDSLPLLQQALQSSKEQADR